MLDGLANLAPSQSYVEYELRRANEEKKKLLPRKAEEKDYPVLRFRTSKRSRNKI